MKLSIDHVPFVCNSTSVLQSSFRGLGFRCSPSGEYTSPEFPNVVWRTTCVFLSQGWFDLLEASEATDRGIPGGCLFLSDDLPSILARVSDATPVSQYSLDRRWHDRDEIGEHFKLASFREKICRLPVSVIQHRWPCDDIEPSWTEHPNTAVGLEGLLCSSAKPLEASPLNQILNVSQARDVSPNEFVQRFGKSDHDIAVRVRVENITALSTHLEAASVPHIQDKRRVLAHPPSLDCVFEFVV